AAKKPPRRAGLRRGGTFVPGAAPSGKKKPAVVDELFRKMPRLCRIDRHPGTEGSRWSPSAKLRDHQLRRSLPLVNPATCMPKHWFKECMVKSRTLQGQAVGRRAAWPAP